MKTCSANECQRNAYAREFCTMHYHRYRKHGDPEKTLRSRFRSCSVAGCSEPHKSWGRCDHHYELARQQGEIKIETCVIENCIAPRHGRGLCAGHYAQAKLGGSFASTNCSAEGCMRHEHTNGFCAKHYARFLQYGNPNEPLKRAPPGSGSQTKQKYRIIKMPGHPNAFKDGTISEHIFVMTEILGRPLDKSANVHHRNGIRDD